MHVARCPQAKFKQLYIHQFLEFQQTDFTTEFSLKFSVLSTIDKFPTFLASNST